MSLVDVETLGSQLNFAQKALRTLCDDMKYHMTLETVFSVVINRYAIAATHKSK